MAAVVVVAILLPFSTVLDKVGKPHGYEGTMLK